MPAKSVDYDPGKKDNRPHQPSQTARRTGDVLTVRRGRAKIPTRSASEAKHAPSSLALRVNLASKSNRYDDYQSLPGETHLYAREDFCARFDPVLTFLLVVVRLYGATAAILWENRRCSAAAEAKTVELVHAWLGLFPSIAT